MELNREIFLTLIPILIWTIILVWVSKFYIVQLFVLSAWEIHFNASFPRQRRIMTFFQFFYPDFIFDINSYQRTNKSEKNDFWKNLFFVFLVMVLMFFHSFAIMYYGASENDLLQYLTLHFFNTAIPVPIVVGKSTNVTLVYYFVWCTFSQTILNGFSNKLYSHSELQNRIIHGILVVKNLPINNFSVKQVNSELVIVELHDGTTDAEFKAQKKKLCWAAGIDILHMSPLINGRLEITARLASKSLQEVWRESDSGLILERQNDTFESRNLAYDPKQIFYLIFDPDKPKTGCIKIGVSINPEGERLKTIKTGAPKSQIIWQIPQTPEFNERMVKDSFIHLKDKLEWYHIDLLKELGLQQLLPKE